jgi:hypothetical protein
MVGIPANPRAPSAQEAKDMMRKYGYRATRE